MREIVFEHGSSLDLVVQILSLTGMTVKQPSVAQTIALEPGASVAIPDNLFRERVGENVRVEFKFLKDSELTDAMPGNFRGIARSGENVAIESMGAFYMRFISAGEVLHFAPDKKLQVRLQTRATADFIPVWTLDKASGIWKEEGIARRIAPGLYEAELSHLSWVNLDQRITRLSTIRVKSIVDDRGQRLEPTVLTGSGIDYKGVSAYERIHGGYCLEVKANSTVQLAGMSADGSRVCGVSRSVRVPDQVADCADAGQGVAIELLPMTCRVMTNSERMWCQLFKKIEIIRLRDGRIFRGVIASQVGSRMTIFTADGNRIVLSSEVEDVTLTDETCGQ